MSRLCTARQSAATVASDALASTSRTSLPTSPSSAAARRVVTGRRRSDAASVARLGDEPALLLVLGVGDDLAVAHRARVVGGDVVGERRQPLERRRPLRRGTPAASRAANEIENRFQLSSRCRTGGAPSIAKTLRGASIFKASDVWSDSSMRQAYLRNEAMIEGKDVQHARAQSSDKTRSRPSPLQREARRHVHLEEHLGSLELAHQSALEPLGLGLLDVHISDEETGQCVE